MQRNLLMPCDHLSFEILKDNKGETTRKGKQVYFNCGICWGRWQRVWTSFWACSGIHGAKERHVQLVELAIKIEPDPSLSGGKSWNTRTTCTTSTNTSTAFARKAAGGVNWACCKFAWWRSIIILIENRIWINFLQTSQTNRQQRIKPKYWTGIAHCHIPKLVCNMWAGCLFHTNHIKII